MPVAERGADDCGDANYDCGQCEGSKRTLPKAGHVANGNAGTREKHERSHEANKNPKRKEMRRKNERAGHRIERCERTNETQKEKRGSQEHTAV